MVASTGFCSGQAASDGAGRPVAPQLADRLDERGDRVPLGDRAQHGRASFSGRREGVGQEGQREHRGEHRRR